MLCYQCSVQLLLQVSLLFLRQKSQLHNTAMEIVLDFVPLAQTVAKERVKDVKGVVKMDVKVDVQVAVHNLVVMGAVLAVKEVA